MAPNRAPQQGYMIAEALIAGAIAAAVIVAIMTSMSTSARAISRAQTIIEQTRELQNIEAGLRAGLSVDEVRSAHPNWSIDPGPDPASYNEGTITPEKLQSWHVTGPGVTEPHDIWVIASD